MSNLQQEIQQDSIQQDLTPDLAPTECNSYKPSNKICCFEVWQISDKESLLAYSMQISGIKYFMDKYSNLIKNGKLQLKFVDYNTDLTCNIDVSDEIKNKIIEFIQI